MSLRCPAARSPTDGLNKEPRGESSYLEAPNRWAVGRPLACSGSRGFFNSRCAEPEIARTPTRKALF